MRFLHSLSGVTLRDRIKSEEFIKEWKVEEIIDDIQNYKLKWNQHVLRMPENTGSSVWDVRKLKLYTQETMQMYCLLMVHTCVGESGVCVTAH